MRILLVLGVAAALGACASDDPRSSERPPRSRQRSTRSGGPASVADGSAPAASDASVAPPEPPPPEGPTGEGRVMRLRGLPAPRATDAGYEPIDIDFGRLEKLLVDTDAVGRGTRQAFRPAPERDWGERPLEPFAFRKDGEPLHRPGYWHPLPRLSILIVPFGPVASGDLDLAFYELEDGGVRFIRSFGDHGLRCATEEGLIEGLAIHSGGAEVRRLYGCPGLGEEATIEIVRLEGRRLVQTIVRGSFLVHRAGTASAPRSPSE